MPRPRPPHLHRERTRHGRTAWYVRIGHGSRIRLRAEYGTPEFEAEYRAALEGRPPASRERAATMGSLTWLVERYRETIAWTGLSFATRRQRENIMAGVLAQAGHEPAAAIKRAHIVAGRDRRGETPAQARHFLDAMRGLFRWALDAGHVKADPTVGIANPAQPERGGFPVWTEDDVARYEACWPVGTKERVWLDVLLYTGLRRGDAVQLGRQHVLRSQQGLAASSHSSAARRASRSRRNPLAICSVVPVALLACRSPRTAFARSARRAQRRTARRLPSLKRSSVGPATVWLRSTRAGLIARGSRRAPCLSSPEERQANILFPHLWKRCGIEREKRNDFRRLNFRWWAH
jgi:site-specific recombinase XerC